MCIFVWFNIFSHANKVIKTVQREGMQLDTAAKLINVTLYVIKEFWNSDFEKKNS